MMKKKKKKNPTIYQYEKKVERKGFENLTPHNILTTRPVFLAQIKDAKKFTKIRK